MLSLDFIVCRSHASSITNKPQSSYVPILWFYIKQTNVPNKQFKLKVDKHQENKQFTTLQNEYTWKVDWWDFIILLERLKF